MCVLGMEREGIYGSAIGAKYLDTLGREPKIVASAVAGAIDLALSLKILNEKPQRIVDRWVGKDVVFVKILGLQLLDILCLEIGKQARKLCSRALYMLVYSVLFSYES